MRAAKKVGSLSLSLLSESPPGRRGARGTVSISRDGGGRGGRRSPTMATDADARRSDRNGPPLSSVLASTLAGGLSLDKPSGHQRMAAGCRTTS